ncbi:hypothetical protein BJ741DRAFT_621851 [Chytriomyces cf. hyalinus JEL632]|nr:hypothetical protein BJ741DRAFT_621851 [Chytriomyces cf. hyalinus JEL632]
MTECGVFAWNILLRLARCCRDFGCVPPADEAEGERVETTRSNDERSAAHSHPCDAGQDISQGVVLGSDLT